MQEQIIGVGPYPQPWPTEPIYDSELLENGDRRNVLDKYRYWKVEAIKAYLDKDRLPLHIAIENWQHDMNIGTIVRNANAFNVAAVHIIGKRHWNRRGAMVTDRYLNIFHHTSVDDFALVMKKSGREIVAIDNQAGSLPLSETKLGNKVVLVFGGEGPGLSSEMIGVSTKMIHIEQFGSTRSVNVGVAAGIVMYEWIRTNLLETI